MKKTWITMMAVGVFACAAPVEEEKKPISTNTENINTQIGGEKQSEPVKVATADAPKVEEKKPEAPAGKDGSALIEGSDCRTCHKNDAKLIGPSYKDVAKKYPNTPENVKMLAEKIIQGGQGNWGEIPMAAHPGVSQADAEAMVKYILTLK
jgi:cytochrome c